MFFFFFFFLFFSSIAWNTRSPIGGSRGMKRGMRRKGGSSSVEICWRGGETDCSSLRWCEHDRLEDSDSSEGTRPQDLRGESDSTP